MCGCRRLCTLFVQAFSLKWDFFNIFLLLIHSIACSTVKPATVTPKEMHDYNQIMRHLLNTNVYPWQHVILLLWRRYAVAPLFSPVPCCFGVLSTTLT